MNNVRPSSRRLASCGRALVFICLLLASYCRCEALSADAQSLYKPWLWQTMHQSSDFPDFDVTPIAEFAGPAPVDNDSFSERTVYELHRLFSTSSGNYQPNVGRIERKALVMLPFLGRSNGLKLFLTPQPDLYSALFKRISAKSLRKTPAELPVGKIAIDTHVHTSYSHDSLADISRILSTAARRGFSAIAVTDHDAIEGSRKATIIAQSMVREGRLPKEFFVIPGEEVGSSEGHIIALFVTEAIQPGLTASETIEAIHTVGGLAIAAHPLLSNSLGDLAKTLPFDAVETMNGAEEIHFGAEGGRNNQRRASFYADVTKPRIGASDAHDASALASCYTVLSCEPTPEAVRNAITRGECVPTSSLVAARKERSSLRKPSIPDLLLAGISVKGMSTQSNIWLWPHPVAEWSRQF
jgi:predicted metal-dependent phosphoesterase TrpH